jgi:hypothetical protein
MADGMAFDHSNGLETKETGVYPNRVLATNPWISEDKAK